MVDSITSTKTGFIEETYQGAGLDHRSTAMMIGGGLISDNFLPVDQTPDALTFSREPYQHSIIGAQSTAAARPM